MPERVLSYGELDRRVSAMVAGLEEHGVRAGDRVALLLPTGEEILVLILAILRLGAVACPLSTRLPERSIKEKLALLSPKLLVTDQAITASDTAIVCPSELIPRLVKPSVAGCRLVPDHPATVIFTSGSTGVPKAAVHSLRNHYFSAIGSNRNISLEHGDVWLINLPLYHVGGLSILFRCLIAGAAMALSGNLAANEAIRNLRVTHVSMVATQLRRFLREEDRGPASLRAVLVGGSALPFSLVEEAYGRGLPVHTTYGLTEMASQVTSTPAGASLEVLRTSGRVLPYRGVAIGAGGEVLVRGETLFMGYLTPNGIHRPVDEEGWFHTGDLGEMHESGYLCVSGRKDNMFISGGENIQPEEIESVLGRIDGVARSVIVPMPDEEFGFRPAAFVELDAPDLSVADLRERLAEVLPRFMLPVRFYPWPKISSGEHLKLDRSFFREHLETVLERERGEAIGSE